MSLKHAVLVASPLLLLLTACPMWRGKGGFIDRATLKDLKERNDGLPLPKDDLLESCMSLQGSEKQRACIEQVRNFCAEDGNCD